MPNLFKNLLIASLFILFSHLSFAQADLVAALNQQLIPLKTLKPDTDFSDLEKLRDILKDKQVIGLGEATHGTHEFFLFKHRMLEFLVKEMGVKTFVIEDDFANAQIMNDYLVNGKGNFNKGIQGIGFGIWMTEEFMDMVRWMKAYNDTQKLENKIRFFGCDMQWPQSAMQRIKDYLILLNQYTLERQTGFDMILQNRSALTAKQKAAFHSTVNDLANIKFIGVDTALHRHYVRELQQLIAYMDAKSTLFPARQSDWRDKCMAENVEWIYNYTNHNKMMVWAHNAHINKSAGSDGYVRMGTWLDKSFKGKYYAMGFDFSTGNMRSFDMKLKKNVAVDMPASKPVSSGAIFAQCNKSNFILDLKSASSNPEIKAFLNNQVPSSFYGAAYTIGQAPYYVTHKLIDTFDAVIFIKDTSASLDIK